MAISHETTPAADSRAHPCAGVKRPGGSATAGNERLTTATGTILLIHH